MNYFVLINGQRFGPANITMLNQWAAEGRLGPNTLLEEEGTYRQMTASQLPGLHVQLAPGFQQRPGYVPPGGWSQPPTPQPYPGYYPGSAGSPAQSNDLTIAWVCSGMSVLVCMGCGPLALPLPIAGLVFAIRAGNKGHPGALGAKIFSIVMIILPLLAMFAGCGLMSLQ